MDHHCGGVSLYAVHRNLTSYINISHCCSSGTRQPAYFCVKAAMSGSSWVYPSKTPTVYIRNWLVFLTVCPSISRHFSLLPNFSNPFQYLCQHPPVGGRKVKTVQSWALSSQLCHPYQHLELLGIFAKLVQIKASDLSTQRNRTKTGAGQVMDRASGHWRLTTYSILVRPIML